VLIVLPFPNIAVTIYEYMLVGFDLGEMGCNGVDRIGVAQDRNSWRAVVNVVRSLGVA
jgi:hypothetical protein